MINPEVLIISNRFDFSTDFIAIELKKNSVEYLRINRDDLKDYFIELDPYKAELNGSFCDYSFKVSPDRLKSVYYRAPSFLRDIYQPGLDEEEQLIRTQWAAFVRSLCVYEGAKWFNNPAAIYKAEIKPYQLYLAKKIGFDVPETKVSNKVIKFNKKCIAIKSLDTAIVSKGEEEGFVYTEIFSDYNGEERYSAPFFSQEGLLPKIDVRVTVVEETLIAVQILSENGVDVDWRRCKDDLKYKVFDLPKKIHDMCLEYVRALDLRFGAIDMIFAEGKYFFIEINPTGEWSWLQQKTGMRFDKVIVDSLKR